MVDQALQRDRRRSSTGYPAISIWHDFKYHPKDVIGGTQDWVYEHLGALFWVVEIWAPNGEAGITGYKWIDWYREHPVEDDLKLHRSGATSSAAARRTSTGSRSCTRSSARSRSAAGTR